MDERGSRLYEIYSQAYRLGEELARLLQAPPTGETLSGVERLVADRAVLADAAAVEIGQSGTDPEAAAALARLLEQQVSLESLLGRIGAVMQHQRAGSQQQRADVQMAGRILSPGVRSRLVNERR